MATVVKTFTGAETFAEVGTSGSIAFSSGTNFTFTSSTSSMSGEVETGRQATGDTWETWGVPSGSTVTSVQVTGYTYAVTNTANRVGPNTTTIRVVDNSATNITTAVLKTDTRTTGSGSGTAGTDQSVLGSYQSSTQGVRLQIQQTLDSSSGSVNWSYALDNIALTITYTPPTVHFSGNVSSSVAYASTISQIRRLSGDVSSSVAYTGTVGITKNLSGDVTSSVAYASTVGLSATFSGDVTSSVAYASTVQAAVIFAGDVSSSVAYSASVAVGAHFEGNVSSSVAYTANVQSAADPSVHFSGNISSSIAYASALSITKVFSGDVTSSVAYASTVLVTKVLAGDVSSSIEYVAEVGLIQRLSGNISSSIAYTADVTWKAAYEPIGVLRSFLTNQGESLSILTTDGESLSIILDSGQSESILLTNDTKEHMSNTYYIKKGDTAQTIRTRLEDENGPVSLSGSTVNLIFRLKGAAAATLTVAATPDADQVANKGEVYRQFITSDYSSLVVGEYEVQWEVTFPDASERNFPTSRLPQRSYNYLVVYENF